MKLLSRLSGRSSGHLLFAFLLVLCSFERSRSQTANASERAFPQSKDAIQQVLKKIQPSTAGRLPVLEGFVDVAGHSFERYRRAYYQSTVQVTSSATGGSLVRVRTRITAWYADPVASHSGYRLLNSNGRLEADLLDQLSDELTAKAASVPASSPAVATDARTESAGKAVVSAPPPRPPELAKQPEPGVTFSSSLSQSLSAREQVPSQKQVTDADKDLEAATKNLEEILKNQAHPKNLVAVKKSGTPVVSTPSLTAKALFLASAHDEFEMLNFNADWVHVRISGLSRGWIWRNSVEMPDGIPDVVDPHAGSAPRPPADEVFHVAREETAPFPGDWEPLRSKSVKIISVQKSDESVKEEGAKLKLEFAKSLLDSNCAELEQRARELAGIVLIFDSADGGMIAVPTAVVEQWKAGRLSDPALWHQSFFDPPEMFASTGSLASQ